MTALGIFTRGFFSGGKVGRRQLAEELIIFWRNKVLPKVQPALFEEEIAPAGNFITDKDIFDIVSQARKFIQILQKPKKVAIFDAVKLKEAELQRELAGLTALLKLALD